MSSILIENGFIVTMNSNRKIIRNGSIYIEKNKIVEVEESDNMKNKSAEITIDAKNKLILPGYVNVHTHLPSVFVRGVYGVVAKGLTSVLFPLKTYFTQDDMYLFGLVSCIKALHGGSTTIAENYNYLDSFALAVKETGIRAILGEQIAEADLLKIKDDIYQYNPDQAEAALGRAKKLIKKWCG